MVAFYNKADQELYKTYQYLPQEQYRLGLNLPKAEQETSAINTSYGIPNTESFSNNEGGNSFFSGSNNALVSGFNKAITDRQTKLEELNRPLRQAQFPIFPGARTFPGAPDVPAFDANRMYNEAAAAKAKGELYQGFTGARNPDEVMDYANEALMDYQEKYRTGQLGPSYIEAEKPTLKRRISDMFYSIPGIDKPQSARDILESGYTGTGSGPGIMAAILSKMDRYSTLPRANQAFIASKMGYRGPTIFGENTSGLPKDPFGVNTRSLRGDYAEFTVNRAKELNESIQKSKDRWMGKHGSLDTRNEFGKTWSEMNKMNLSMQEFYNTGAEELQGIKDKAYQDRIDTFVRNYKRPAVKKMFDDVYDGTNIHGGKDNITTGGGDGFTGSGNFSNIDNSGKNYGPYSGGSGGVHSNEGSGVGGNKNSQGMTSAQHGAFRMARGGLASIL